jgi:DHA1 family bicyclomycin/chloramphenicol resistance-like MFS transporter
MARMRAAGMRAARLPPQAEPITMPLMVYTFGLAVAMPAIQVAALGLFPDNRGLASSMLAFIQMMAFALVSGLVAPLLFGSAFRLACGVAVGLVGSFVACQVGNAMARGRVAAA